MTYKKIGIFFAALLILASIQVVLAQEPAEWQEFETEHFIIRYIELDNSTLYMIAEEAENAYDKVTSDLQCHPENKTVVRIGTDEQDHESAEWFGSYSIGSNLIDLLSPTQKRWTNYESYIRKSMHHEYTHHVIFSEYNMVFPDWLNEGVATYEAGEKPEDQHEYKEFQNAAAKNKLVPLDDMWIFDLLEDDERHLAYLEAYTVIEYIESEYGHDTLIDILNARKNEPDMDLVLTDTLGVSYEEFQIAWMAYVKEKYGKPSYDYVYISLYLILVALLLRRRRRIRAQRKNTNSGS
jgi:hypothetical protein